MRISQLQIHNYKSFESLILDDLGQRIVLLGPNGCGKSSVLEAISILKEYAATYHDDSNTHKRNITLNGPYGLAWPNGISLPIRSGSSSATVRAKFEFDNTEQSITHEASAFIGIEIKSTSEIVLTDPVSAGVTKLLRSFDPNSGVGLVDYIRAC